MKTIIEILTEHGYTREQAEKLCRDFIVNLGIVNLELFVEHVCEKNVAKV